MNTATCSPHYRHPTAKRQTLREKRTFQFLGLSSNLFAFVFGQSAQLRRTVVVRGLRVSRHKRRPAKKRVGCDSMFRRISAEIARKNETILARAVSEKERPERFDSYVRLDTNCKRAH